jgi:ribosome-binding factor A
MALLAMKNKLEQVNQAYRKALGQILLRKFPEKVQLLVSDVLIDPSYHHGRVWLRTDHETLAQVVQQRSDIQQQLTRYVKTRYTPKLTFLIDEGDMDKIDDLFEEVKKQK